jgi:hypothetical protein
MMEVREIFNELGVPEKFLALPYIEDTALYSLSGEGPFWICYLYGRASGLIIKDDYDERYSPVRSGYAFCKMIRFFFTIYHDWNFACYAHIYGPSSLNDLLLKNQWDSKSMSLILPAFFSQLDTIYLRKKNEISLEKETMKIVQDSLSDTIYFEAFHYVLSYDDETIKQLNPEYKKLYLYPVTYKNTYRLPKKWYRKVLARKKDLYAYRPPRIFEEEYIVSKGESWESVANQFHLTIKELKACNPQVTVLMPGVKLKICKNQ